MNHTITGGNLSVYPQHGCNYFAKEVLDSLVLAVKISIPQKNKITDICPTCSYNCTKKIPANFVKINFPVLF